MGYGTAARRSSAATRLRWRSHAVMNGSNPPSSTPAASDVSSPVRVSLTSLCGGGKGGQEVPVEGFRVCREWRRVCAGGVVSVPWAGLAGSKGWHGVVAQKP